jgi:glyceraldehyde-3-phosphate dehydrogenase (NADP+)
MQNKTIYLYRKRKYLWTLLCLFCPLLFLLLGNGRYVFADSSSTSPASTASSQQCTSSIHSQWKLQAPPYVEPKSWLPEFVSTDYLSQMKYNDVIVSAGIDDNEKDDAYNADKNLECNDTTPIPKLKRVTIGQMPQFDTYHSMAVLKEAVDIGWYGGYGAWPQMSLNDRINAMEVFLNELQKSRTDIINALTWEIQKNYIDSAAEFDRTIQFAKQVIETIRTDSQFFGSWQIVGNNKIFTKRTAIGVVLCLAPYNYPINESYAAIIPALLMGNIIILKIPTIGGLAHLLTMDAFAKAFPKGTVNFISGGGRTTMPPLMETGLIDVLSFIGSKNAADQLLHIHPKPHRLKVFLQLEAKNMGIFLDNLFYSKNEVGLDHAINEVMTGTLSYNGQRCTALKLLFVPTKHVTKVLLKLCDRVDKLPIGLPWQVHDGDQPSKITPLPTIDRIKYMQDLLADAIEKGATIMNDGGGTILGNSNNNNNSSTLMIPAVVYPILPGMRLYTEEQFGPIIAVSPYDSIDTIYDYAQIGIYGQQVSIFTDDSDKNYDPEVYKLIDKFSTIFGKININSQCGRSPDTVPFSGRRSSALGVMSVKDALLEFSIPTVLAYNTKLNSEATIQQTMSEHSIFVKAIDNNPRYQETT